MNVPRKMNLLNFIESILNGETSKKTQNSPIKMKKTTKTNESSKKHRSCAAKLNENCLMNVSTKIICKKGR